MWHPDPRCYYYPSSTRDTIHITTPSHLHLAPSSSASLRFRPPPPSTLSLQSIPGLAPDMIVTRTSLALFIPVYGRAPARLRTRPSAVCIDSVLRDARSPRPCAIPWYVMRARTCPSGRCEPAAGAHAGVYSPALVSYLTHRVIARGFLRVSRCWRTLSSLGRKLRTDNNGCGSAHVCQISWPVTHTNPRAARAIAPVRTLLQNQ
ncbi:hypothetical protein C2E23DRAFT_113275 [Lenzites betulinus]|nr:hypothetical protein C2E23DRAFT_113275 [Lenzites betulinus]